MKIQAFQIKKSDSRYPPLLSNIHHPPLLLYVRGDLPSFEDPIIAIVGTRFPSNYGKEMTKFFTEYLVQAGFLIVSGFATGVDFIAHQTAVETGGKTIAVLGSGIDVIYPPENRHFEKEILKNGAFISELPPGTQPAKYTFPQRNRIISGMSHATLIVEAPEKSGALITAEFAVEEGREIFAVPGNIGQKNSVGTNQLIQKGGAMLVTYPSEILEQLKLQPSLFSLIEKISPKKKLSPEEQIIFQLLENGPLQIDDIIVQTTFSAAQCGNILMSLLLKNLVSEDCKIFSLKSLDRLPRGSSSLGAL